MQYIACNAGMDRLEYSHRRRGGAPGSIGSEVSIMSEYFDKKRDEIGCEDVREDLRAYVSARLDPASYDRTSEAFRAIGFPDDAADFLGEWYPEACLYAHDRMVYGAYDWATVGVFDHDEALSIVRDIYGEDATLESIDDGWVLEDASFDGVILLLS